MAYDQQEPREKRTRFADREIERDLYKEYEKIIGMLVTMEKRATDWTF